MNDSYQSLIRQCVVKVKVPDVHGITGYYMVLESCPTSYLRCFTMFKFCSYLCPDLPLLAPTIIIIVIVFGNYYIFV